MCVCVWGARDGAARPLSPPFDQSAGRADARASRQRRRWGRVTCVHTVGWSCARAVVKSVTDGPFSEPSSEKLRNTASLRGHAVKHTARRLFLDVLRRNESQCACVRASVCQMKGARNASGNAPSGPDATIGLSSIQITAFLVSFPLRRRSVTLAAAEVGASAPLVVVFVPGKRQNNVENP